MVCSWRSEDNLRVSAFSFFPPWILATEFRSSGFDAFALWSHQQWRMRFEPKDQMCVLMNSMLMWETGRSKGFCVWGGGINTGVKCFTNVITWKYFHECFPDSISGMETGSEWKGMWQVRWTLAGWRFHLKYEDYSFFSGFLPQRLLSSLIKLFILRWIIIIILFSTYVCYHLFKYFFLMSL